MRVHTQGISQMYRLPRRELRMDKTVLLCLLFTVILLIIPGENWNLLSVSDLPSEAVEALNREWSVGIFAMAILVMILGRQGRRALLTAVPAMLLVWKILLPASLTGQDPLLPGMGITAAWTACCLLIRYGADKRFLAAFGSVLTTMAAVLACWLLSGGGDAILLGGILMGTSGAMLYGIERMMAAMQRSLRWQPGLTWRETAMTGIAAGRMNLGIMGASFLNGCMGASLVFFAEAASGAAQSGMESGSQLLGVLLIGFLQILIIPATAFWGGLIFTGARN